MTENGRGILDQFLRDRRSRMSTFTVHFVFDLLICVIFNSTNNYFTVFPHFYTI